MEFHPGSIPGLRRSPGEGIGYPLQYSGLENSMGCIVHGVAKSWTRLSNLHFHFHQEAFYLIVGRLYVNLGSGSQAFGNIFALQVGPQGCMCSWALLWTVCLRRWRHPTHQVGGALLAPSRHWWFLVNLELMSNTPILRKNDICYYVIQSTLVNYIFS